MQLSAGPVDQALQLHREIVLNAQLQTIVSLLEYAGATGDAAAGALASVSTRRAGAVAALRHRRLVALRARRRRTRRATTSRSSRSLLAKLAAQTQDPFWVDASHRFHAYSTSRAAVTRAGAAADLAAAARRLPRRGADPGHALAARVRHARGRRARSSTYRLAPGAHVADVEAPAGSPPGTYPVQISTATNRAGTARPSSSRRSSSQWDTAPPAITQRALRRLLAWQATDPGTPWLALARRLRRPDGRQAAADARSRAPADLAAPRSSRCRPARGRRRSCATNSAGLTTTRRPRNHVARARLTLIARRCAASSSSSPCSPARRPARSPRSSIHRVHGDEGRPRLVDRRSSRSRRRRRSRRRCRRTIAWPTYGFDATRDRARYSSRCGRRSAGSGRTARAASSSSRRDRLRAAVLLDEHRHASPRSARRPASARGSTRSHRCVAASPAIGPHAARDGLRGLPQPAAVQRASGGHDGEVDRLLRRLRQDPLAARHRRRRRARRSSSTAVCTSATGTAACGRSTPQRPDDLADRDRRRSQGRGRVAGGRLYVGSYDGHVYCLDARTGKLIWRASAQPRLSGTARFYSTPAVAYGRVYIGSTDGKVYSFGAASGKLRWSHGTGGYVYASPAVWNRLVLVGSYSRRFYALDAATGDVRWTLPRERPDLGLGDGRRRRRLLRDARRQRTYALDARTGKLLWTFPDGKYTPVVADERPPVPHRLRQGLWDGPAMRYVVTGAAGFIGSHSRRDARRGGARRRRRRLLHRLLRPWPRRRRTRAASTCCASTSRRTTLDSRRRRRRLPPRGAGRRAQLRRRLSALRAPERARDAARVRGCGRRRRARRLRVVVVGLRRGRGLSDAGGRRRRARSRPYGITKLALRAARARLRAQLRPRRGRAALLHRLRPAAAARHVLPPCLRGARSTGGTFEIYGDGRAVAQLHLRRRRRRRDDRGDGARRRRGRLQRRRRRRGDDARGDRAARAGLGTQARRRSTSAAAKGDIARTKADVARIRADARLGAADVARATVSPAMWSWASARVAAG